MPVPLPISLPRPSLSRVAAALAAAGGLALAAPVQAETFNLGLISEAATVTIGNSGLPLGWITDVYTFTVAEGLSIDFTGFVSNLYGRNLAGSANLGSTLFSGDPSFVQVADASTRFTDNSYFTVERTLTYAPTVLEAGSYGLYVTGLVTQGGFRPADPASYTGQLRFGSAAAPVPEPGAWALMAVGLVGVGAAARRKRRGAA